MLKYKRNNRQSRNVKGERPMSYTKKTAAKAEERKKSWTDLTGTMKVFGKKKESSKGDFIAYSTSIGKKQEDGSYQNFFFNVRFTKDNDPEKEGAFDIEIGKAFFTVDSWNEKNYPAIVIQDFDFI